MLAVKLSNWASLVMEVASGTRQTQRDPFPHLETMYTVILCDFASDERAILGLPFTNAEGRDSAGSLWRFVCSFVRRLLGGTASCFRKTPRSRYRCPPRWVGLP